MSSRIEAVRARLAPLATKSWFRIGIAALFLAFHMVMFAAAGRARLEVPFNTAPGKAPYYSDPDAPSLAGYPRQPHYWSRLIVSRWDAQHYIGFAVRGLTACPDDPSQGTDMQYLMCGLTWFPAYGKAGGVIADTTGMPADIALLFISLLAAMIINILWTSKTITDRLGTLETYATLVAFNLFPSAFYIVTPYTEATTFALMLAGFLCLAQHRWFAAALLVGAATSLRPTAVGFAFAFGCAALVAAWQLRRDGSASWWRPIAAAPIAIWGLVANFVLLQIFVGDAFAYFRAGSFKNEWLKQEGGLQFLRLFDPEWYITGFGFQHLDSVTVLGSFGFMLLAGREALRRFKLHEAVFIGVATGAMVVLPLMAMTQYWGLNRYFLLAPLTFLALGVTARRHPALYLFWLVISVAIYWHVEMCSYITQGDGKTCPCLGKIEAQYPY